MAKKIIIAVSVIIALLLGVGVWWMFDTGRLVYSQDGDTAPSSASVCGLEMVESYNNSFVFDYNEDRLTVDQGNLDRISDEIKSSEGYESDPTCQTILFWHAVRADDHEAATKAHESILDLHSKGQFANSDIRDAYAVSSLKMHVDSLTGSGADFGG